MTQTEQGRTVPTRILQIQSDPNQRNGRSIFHNDRSISEVSPPGASEFWRDYPPNGGYSNNTRHPRIRIRARAKRGSIQGKNMALFKYDEFVKKTTHAAFDTVTGPGQPVPHSGIYRCEGCGQEIAANQGNPMPPQNHHQHSTTQGAIRWRLCVCTGT